MTQNFLRYMTRLTRKANGGRSISKYTPHQGEQEKARRRARLYPADWCSR